MKRTLLVLMYLILSLSLSGNDGYRRNLSVDIINYSFRLSISDTSDIIFGSSTISLIFTGETKNMEFDLKNIRPDGKGMLIDSVSFSGGGIKWSHRENKITVISDKTMAKGTLSVLKIVYHGIPADGLIISNNKFSDRTFFSDNWPDRASNYLPCTDHPYDKATVEFYIKAPAHYEVVGSGYLVEESHLPAGMKMTHWKEDVPLATKVMAFGAADFDFQLAGSPENIPVWTYVFKENRNDGFSDYSSAVKPLTFFTRLIGPYPYEKLANVQSKTTFGGLENAGCIFYAENSVTGRNRAEGLLTHEIAHQWFGNSVTENDWHHIWLSEGFATFLTNVYMEMNYGKIRLAENMKSDRNRVINYFLRYPAPVIDTAITDLMKLLSPNSYQKGGWVLHMLRHKLGDETFWKGMRLYYEKFRNKNALTADFQKVMEDVSKKDLNSFFYQWLYVAGQPDLLISTKPSAKNGQIDIIIEQKQKYLFSFPLELLLKCMEGDQEEKINVTDRITRIRVKTQKLNELIPDPETNLLFRKINE